MSQADPPPSGPAAPDRPGRGAAVLDALTAVLRPLARLAVRRGVGLGALTPALKHVLVETAAETPETGGPAGRPPSQSRISLMTGVHRKDVRDILAGGRPHGESPREPPRPSIAETVMARWLALPPGPDGRPPVLPRRDPTGTQAAAGEAPGFDALVAGVSQDVRPRAVLEEMIRLGLVAAADGRTLDDADARLRLVADAHLPAEGREAERLALFAGNLADHAATAAGNLLAGPGEARRLEQAVFHTHLAPDSVAELEAEARRLSGEALRSLNRRALDLQRRDLARGTATRRFRFGVYFHDAPLDPAAGAGDDDSSRPERAADGGGAGEDRAP